MRPQSIVNFERLYAGAIILGLINAYLSWNRTLALLQAQPTVHLGSTFLIASMAIGLLIQLLLWYFIARRGSVVAKWILVVLFGLGLLGLLLSLVQGRLAGGLTLALTVIAWLLQAGAVWMLFRPDARIWFGETKAVDPNVFR